jgi:hypothetical protein
MAASATASLDTILKMGEDSGNVYPAVAVTPDVPADARASTRPGRPRGKSTCRT